MRGTTDSVTFFHALETAPYRHDFYQALRRIECMFPGKPRWGQALRPADEPVRLGQEPDLSFAPATLSSFDQAREGRRPRLGVRFFGLFGPNGPLPLHLTEYARERLLHSNDATFPRFLDLFHHRFLLLFYRAWAQSQPTVSLDRAGDDRFSGYIGAAFGLGTPRMRKRDSIPDFAKLYFAGLLARQVRNADGLMALLAGYFRVPVQIERFVGHWMNLPVGDRTRLGAPDAGAKLGYGTVLGARVWDRQHKFRIRLGPLSLEQYESFLPGGTALPALVSWVRQYLCYELEWDLGLVLAAAQVPPLQPGRYGRLGWTAWLGRRVAAEDASDLTLDAEKVLDQAARANPQRPESPQNVTVLVNA